MIKPIIKRIVNASCEFVYEAILCWIDFLIYPIFECLIIPVIDFLKRKKIFNLRNKTKQEDNTIVAKIFSFIFLFGFIFYYIPYWLKLSSGIFTGKDNGLLNTWITFFGSYAGGIIGGAATLIAVVFTTNETRKIQEENKIETRKIQEENKKLQIMQYKKIYTDEIAEHISDYISDMCGYFYAQWYNTSEWTKKIDRKKSIDIYFLLQIKLKDEELAKELLDELDYIHKKLYIVKKPGDKNERLEFEKSYKELLKLTRDFINEYMNT